MEILLVIQKDEHSTYGVTVPGIAGCFSWGDSVEQAIGNAREAIVAHIDASLATGSDIDIAPVSLEQVQALYPGQRHVFVDIDDRKIDRVPERINISIPRFVLDRIDRHVERRHESRSGFLARAALRQIADEQGSLHSTEPAHGPAVA